MDPATARTIVDELDGVRQRARDDRRTTSVPLLVFGVLTLVDAAAIAAWEPYRSFYWVIAAPAGFAVIAWYYRRHEAAVGVGSPSRTYGRWSLGVLAALVLAPFLILFGAPLGVIGLGLLVIARRQGNLYLGVWAVVYGVVGVLDGFYVITNRLYDVAGFLGLFSDDHGYFSWAPSFVSAALGLLLVGAGLVARRQEMSGAPHG